MAIGSGVYKIIGMAKFAHKQNSISAMSVCLVLGIWSLHGVQSLAQDTVDSDAQWLAVIHGRMVSVDDNQIVVDAYPNIIAFTDRPQRDVALVDLEDFVEAAWGDDGFFADDPPNAALASAIVDDLDTKIIEMVDVVLDRTLMTISMIPLEGDMPVVGDQIVMFIDGFPAVISGFD